MGMAREGCTRGLPRRLATVGFRRSSWTFSRVGRFFPSNNYEVSLIYPEEISKSKVKGCWGGKRAVVIRVSHPFIGMSAGFDDFPSMTLLFSLLKLT
jgi:hypothetical protein